MWPGLSELAVLQGGAQSVPLPDPGQGLRFQTEQRHAPALGPVSAILHLGDLIKVILMFFFVHFAIF